MKNETKDMLKKLMVIAIPIMIQNGITSFVSLLDNVMIGRVGTNPMSGVAIINQIILIWILCVFGGMSGIGIYIAQFYGKKDEDGIRYMVRLEVLMSIFLTIGGIAVALLFKNQMIGFYLRGDGSAADAAETYNYAQKYLKVILLEMIPLVITQSYATTLRGVGNTVIPMRASIAAVFVNLVGNYILIFGKFGAPKLGVVGAAIATVLARVIEMLYIVVWTHRHTEENAFMTGAYKSLYVPKDLMLKVLKKTTPLLLNETLWAAGEAAAALIYSMRGLNVIAAFNISSTVGGVFNIAFIALGTAIGIFMGQQLGMGKTEGIIKRANQCSLFSVFVCVVIGSILLIIAPVFPHFYNTTDEVRKLAVGFLRVLAVTMPVSAYVNALYFTLRSGGRTGITFFFDAAFTWVVFIPAAALLVKFTAINVVMLYLCVKLLELIKVVVGFVLIQKGTWIVDLTSYS